MPKQEPLSPLARSRSIHILLADASVEIDVFISSEFIRWLLRLQCDQSMFDRVFDVLKEATV
jgi:hypothetical protein